jgi:gamma-glutamyltranspeptidase / glutathione hydrolase
MRRGVFVTVVSVACAAVCVAVPAAAWGSRHRADYPNTPVAVGTGGAVASMDRDASGAGIEVL